MNESIVIEKNYNISEPLEYYGDFFKKLNKFYLPIHGTLSLLICFFGAVTNILNIIVLTRKELISPTNNILTGLAFADLVVMIDYIPFVLHFYIFSSDSPESLYSLSWSIFTLLHSHFTVVGHTISTWHTVLLAIWRYISVRFPQRSRSWCTLSNARWLIIGTYICVPVICIPQYLSFKIFSKKDSNGVYYNIDWSDIAISNDGYIKKINFWIFSVGSKLVPCILLTYLSWALINIILEAEKRKQRLKDNKLYSSKQDKNKANNCKINDNTNNHNHNHNKANLDIASITNLPIISSTSPSTGETIGLSSSLLNTTTLTTATSSATNSTNTGNTLPVSRDNTKEAIKFNSEAINFNIKGSLKHRTNERGDRTTRMLLSILILFLITESPAGILGLLSGILGETFYQNVYVPLGEYFDILALINSAVNFILYCTMSQQFRYTFAKLFFL